MVMNASVPTHPADGSISPSRQSRKTREELNTTTPLLQGGIREPGCASPFAACFTIVDSEEIRPSLGGKPSLRLSGDWPFRKPKPRWCRSTQCLATSKRNETDFLPGIRIRFGNGYQDARLVPVSSATSSPAEVCSALVIPFRCPAWRPISFSRESTSGPWAR